MKAVLEFAYPEDEHKLFYALHSEEAFKCLQEIQSLILDNTKNRVPRTKTISQIEEMIRGIPQIF